jgi:hypothetical protein
MEFKDTFKVSVTSVFVGMITKGIEGRCVASPAKLNDRNSTFLGLHLSPLKHLLASFDLLMVEGIDEPSGVQILS